MCRYDDHCSTDYGKSYICLDHVREVLSQDTGVVEDVNCLLFLGLIDHGVNDDVSPSTANTSATIQEQNGREDVCVNIDLWYYDDDDDDEDDDGKGDGDGDGDHE